MLLRLSLVALFFFQQQPEPAGVRRETVLQTTKSWDGTEYTSYPAGKPQVSVVKLTIPANTQLDWHIHPMINAAYVVSGSITAERKSDGKKQTFTAGQVIPETVNALHRGYTGASEANLILFYAGAEGLPLSKTQ